MKITRTTHILLITLFIVVVFSGSLKNNFAWDDKFLIVDNHYIKSWTYITAIFTTQLYEGSNIHSNFYRPFQLLSYMLDYSIWKLNPFGYHLANLFLHTINSVLVYCILIAIGSSSPIPLLTALLFSIAPAISGITYYISARSDLLMALFMFLSLLFFIKYRKSSKKIFYIPSIALFILALLCKEMAIILLFLVPLEIFRSGKRRIREFTSLFPYIVILVLYIGIRLSILNFTDGTNPIIDSGYAAAIPLWRRILTDFKIVPKYLGLLLFPYGLHMEWFIEPARTIFQIDIFSSFIALIFLVLIIQKMLRIDNLILFGALWFILSLLPVLNIYPISVLFGEGWLYVPSVGFFIILSIILERIINPKIGKAATNILVMFLLAYYALFTISYGKIWKDSVSLFHNVIKYEKESPFVHLTYNNLGMAYYDKGELDKSIEYYRKSIALKPGYAEAYNNLGVAYMAEGEPFKAIRHFKKAIGIKKSYVSSYCNLAHAYNSLGLTGQAVRFSRTALKINPDSYEAYRNLGYIYSNKGEVDEAIKFFNKAAEFRGGDYEIHYCLGTLYAKKDKFKEALREYRKAMQLGIGDYRFYNELAFLYIKNNRFKEAEQSLRHSLILNKHQTEPHNNLGNLYSIYGLYELALEEYNKAIAMDPDNHGIQDNIKKLMTEWKTPTTSHFLQ